jgi:hypothetical protein
MLVQCSAVLEDAYHRMTISDERPARRSARVELTIILAIVGLAGVQGFRMLRTSEAPVNYEAGRLVAAGDLEEALYDPAKGHHERGFAVSALRADCRKFTDGKVSGVACERDGDWRIEEMRQSDGR